MLRSHAEFAAVRRTLQQAQAVVEETRSGIWETLRDAIGCLTDPDLAAHRPPRTGTAGLRPRRVRPGRRHPVRDRVRRRRRRPGPADHRVRPRGPRHRPPDRDRRQRHNRSGTAHPPFTAVLDEVASICPLPDLPDTLSDSAGRGVLIHYALQSPAQAQARWGKAAATLFDNTTALTILGGLKSEDTLKWASLLVGRRLEERRSRQPGVASATPAANTSAHERVDILEPAAIRQIPRGRALLILRTMPAAHRPPLTRLDPTRLDPTPHRRHPTPTSGQQATRPSRNPSNRSSLPVRARRQHDPGTRRTR